MMTFSRICTLFAGCVVLSLSLGMLTWALLRGVEVPQAVNLVAEAENFVFGELLGGASNLNLLVGRSFPIADLISLLSLLGLFGWLGARMMRFNRLTGFSGLGVEIGEGVFMKVGDVLKLVGVAGDLRLHAVSPEELGLSSSTMQMSLLAPSDFDLSLEPLSELIFILLKLK